MLKTRVRASLERPGPHHDAANCTNVPTPQNAKCTWGRQATRNPTGPKSQTPPEIPNRNHGKGEDQPDGGFPKTFRGPQGTQIRPPPLSSNSGRYGPSSQIVQPPVRGNRQSWRVETGGKPLRTKNPKKKGNTPTPPPTQDGARGR